MNKGVLNPLLEDKIKFHSILIDNSIDTPKILAYILMNTFYIDNKSLKINDFSSFKTIIKNILSSSESDPIFMTPHDGIGGKNTFIIDSSKINDQSYIEDIYFLSLKYNFIFQETINQNKAVNTIYDKSINTVRVHTYKNLSTEEVEISSSLMRLGVSGNIVDNGGVFIPVNMNNWTLTGKALSFVKSGGNTYKYHPDSKMKFEGFQLPHGQEIEKVVLEAAKLFETLFIGRDVAITNNGISIIEGNSDPHLIMAQTSTVGFLSHPVYKNILSMYFQLQER